MSPTPSPTLRRPARGLPEIVALTHIEHGERGEDRLAADSRRGRYALCDGASEGWDSGAFAAALAGALLRHGATEAAVTEARDDFGGRAIGVGDWLADRARSRGSFSTALLVEVLPGGRLLRASAIGDTTLFVLDGFRTVTTWPIDSAEGYGNTPDLVGDAGTATPAFSRRSFSLGRLRRPSFALVTDALAARLLSATEGEAPELWRFFARASEEAFQAWAADGMADRSLGRDDLSLLWVR
ncbi:MAG: hypothetical protein WCL50_07115 [Spirochaetota bacterium]